MCPLATAPLVPYRTLGLFPLLERVVEKRDRDALWECHDNRWPFVRRKERLRWAEYLDRLREEAPNGGSGLRKCSEEVADRAYDLTLEKFFRLPEECSDEANGEEKVAPARRVVDCRNYLRPVLALCRTLLAANPGMGQLEEERLLSLLLQKHVTRHFDLSIAECLRSANPFVSRYEWKCNGRSIYTWFPIDFPGHERRRWLEENVADPDPYRPEEKQRVQEIIDRRLAKGRHVDLEECESAGMAASASEPGLPFAVLRGTSTDGLAAVVADEKVENLACQRPAVRRLGPVRLREMILHIFGRLDSGEYSDGEIGTLFGLSKPSLSRFAGSRWQRGEAGEDGTAVPDLWVNVAHVLAAHPHFVDAARAAGVWPQVKKVIQACSPRGAGRTSHVE